MNGITLLGDYLCSLTPEERHDPSREVQATAAALLALLVRTDCILPAAYDAKTEDVRVIRIRTKVNGRELPELERRHFGLFDTEETAIEKHHRRVIAVTVRRLLERLTDGEADTILLFTGLDRLWDFQITPQMAEAALKGANL